MRTRKSTLAMSPTEWTVLNNAINKLLTSGKWHDLYLKHAERGADHRMHGFMSGDVGYARFLYWHRAYLLECENALREIDDSITIPYWDWMNNIGVPDGLNHMPIRGVIRNTGTINFTNHAEIQRIMGRASFDGFVRDLENNPHNNGHNWVGGIMSHPLDSPTDPLFYMHHANIDRIWSEWQAKPGNEDKKPNISAEDGILDPWENEWSVGNIHDIADLGENSYSYASPVSSDATGVNPGLLEALRRQDGGRWPPAPSGPLPGPFPQPDPWPPGPVGPLPGPFPQPWPPGPFPQPAPWPWPAPGPQPDPIPPESLERLSSEEVRLVQIMREWQGG